jgi:hypothetical protein
VLRALALAAAPLFGGRAQEPAPAAPAPGLQRLLAACHGQRIDAIVIHASAPTVAGLRRAPFLQSVVRTLHVTTRTEVIRRYLLLEVGQSCDELRRAESERILRAQPFIAEAEVYVVPNDEGGVDLEVRTSDESAIVLGGALRARAPVVTSLLLGNANLAGEGIYASGSWRQGEGFRDGIAGRIIDHQFMGQPWIMGVEGERATLGASWRIDGAHPYLTDLQRVAWRVRTGSSAGYAELRQPDGTRPAVALDRDYYDVGGIVRIGPPGHLGLFGLSVTGEGSRPGDRLLAFDTGVIRDLGPVPVAYRAHRVGRVNALIGLRDIRFIRMEGLDALAAAQDVPIGYQVGGQVGHSVRMLGADEQDVALAGDLYAGATMRGSTLRIQLQGEGRRAIGQSQWDDVLTTGRLTHTRQHSARLVNQLQLEWSGGYRERVPFQLLLGIPWGGVRGYEESAFAGGQRLVARVEERWAFSPVFNFADMGVALFADAGRQWAGDVPYGVTTPVKKSVGISLLAAVPPRSARLWRADLAFPLNSGANARWTLRFTNGDRTAFEFRTPSDVADRRALTAPTSIFAWP